MPGITGQFSSVFMFENNALIASNEDKGILFSTNSGETWSQSSLVTGSFNNVYMFKTNALASSSDDSGILYSTDSGVTWQASSITKGSYLVFMFRKNVIAVSTNGNGILYSNDSGNTWNKSNQTTGSFNTLFMYGKNAIVGSNDGILISSDSGATWFLSDKTTGKIGSLHMVGSNAIAGSSDDIGLFFSRNSGKLWLPTNIKSGSFKVFMVGKNAIAVSTSSQLSSSNKATINNKATTSIGGILYSSNSGVTWSSTNITSGSFDSVYINKYLFSVVSGSSGAYYTPIALCFNHDTKILCLNKNLEEEYVAIQDLQKGDLVKSYLHGYRKIEHIGKNKLVNNPDFWKSCMYKMEKNEENGLTEDLILVGGHSLLVDELSDEVKEKYEELNIWEGKLEKIDEKYLLLAGLSEKFKKMEDKNTYTYYQLILDNEGDENRRFGIYANGVLAETPSEKFFHLVKWEKMG